MMKISLTNLYKDQIKELLLSSEWGGMTTDTLASKLKLSNRQVGAIMGKLKREGFVMTYTKGIIGIPAGLHSYGSKMKLSNSFYEWIIK